MAVRPAVGGSASLIGRIRVLGGNGSGATPPGTALQTSGGGNSVAQAAFGPNVGGTAGTGRHPLHPRGALGLKVILGTASIVGLWWIYHSLPD